MNADQQKALEKIKKCLRLAGSSNPGEAEAAMRQAKALMERFNLSDMDVALSDVGERLAAASAASQPVRYECWLADVCAKAFRCELLFTSGFLSNTGSWKFIGIEPNCELASYAFSVLLRQLKRDRKAYQDNDLKRFGRKNKIAMADKYCEHWVVGVEPKLAAFAGGSEAQQAIVQQYMAAKYPSLSSFNPKVNSGSANPDRLHDASAAGRKAGASAQLNRAMSGGNAQSALERLS